MSLSIAGKTAIVTGSANGIGLAIARHFLDKGANVMFADMELIGTPPAAPAPPSDLGALLAQYSAALAINPFLETQPMQLEQVVPQLAEALCRLAMRATISLALLTGRITPLVV